jgi:hypothetical protein
MTVDIFHSCESGRQQKRLEERMKAARTVNNQPVGPDKPCVHRHSWPRHRPNSQLLYDHDQGHRLSCGLRNASRTGRSPPVQEREQRPRIVRVCMLPVLLQFQRPLPHYLPDSIAAAGCSCSSSGVESWVFATIGCGCRPCSIHGAPTRWWLHQVSLAMDRAPFLMLSALLAFIFSTGWHNYNVNGPDVRVL